MCRQVLTCSSEKQLICWRWQTLHGSLGGSAAEVKGGVTSVVSTRQGGSQRIPMHGRVQRCRDCCCFSPLPRQMRLSGRGGRLIF